MHTTSSAVDHHQRSCDALARSTPLLIDAVRRAPGTVRPPGMRWTNGEIAAHLFASVAEADKAIRGERSVYDAQGPSAVLDEEMVADVPERDPAALAHLIELRTASFLDAARARPGGDRLAPPGSSPITFVSLLALDHHLHGGQFAETANSSWGGQVADLHSPLSAVLPYAFDPVAAGGFRGSFALRLRGVEPVRYAVEDGRLVLGGADRPDCTITSDPQSFLRFGIGVVSQLRLVLTARLRVSGRRPWLASKTTQLFPPVPHGGVMT